MNYKEILLKYSHKLYRLDEFINDFYESIGNSFDFLQVEIEQIILNSLISSADLQTVEMYEEQMKIIPNESQSLEERRSMIIAKLRGNNTFNLEQIQNICDSWKNGEVIASFENGKIKLTFIGDYGIPADLDGLKAILEEMKPAHLGIFYNIKYILIKDIQEMTLTEVENHLLKDFAGRS